MIFLRLALETHYWTIITHVVYWGSLLFYFFLVFLESQFAEFYPDAYAIFGNIPQPLIFPSYLVQVLCSVLFFATQWHFVSCSCPYFVMSFSSVSRVYKMHLPFHVHPLSSGLCRLFFFLATYVFLYLIHSTLFSLLNARCSVTSSHQHRTHGSYSRFLGVAVTCDGDLSSSRYW